MYNRKTFAKMLGVSVETLDRYKKAGKLPHHIIGDRILFTDSDLTDFLALCAVPAKETPTARESLEMSKAVKAAS